MERASEEAPRRAARRLRDSAGLFSSQEDAEKVQRDAEKGRRKPQASKKVRRLASMGPTGRARQAAKGIDTPRKGKGTTGAKTKADRLADGQKRQAPKKLKTTRGSPSAKRRIGNRGRARTTRESPQPSLQ